MNAYIDLSAVEVFLRVSELRSFTHAAEALGTTQSCISLKLKRLENLLGYSLMERTPRNVRLSPAGEAFIQVARDLLAAQHRALTKPSTKSKRLALGISDFVGGPDFAPTLAKTMELSPAVSIEVKIGTSSDMLGLFDEGNLDAVIVRSERRRRDGEELFIDEYDWYGSADPAYGEPLRLVSVSANCGVRSIATRLLTQAGIPWVNAFVGGGLSDVIKAVSCGVGVSPLPCRFTPASTKPVGMGAGLPSLPASRVVLHTLTQDVEIRRLLKYLATSMRDTKGSPPLLRLA